MVACDGVWDVLTCEEMAEEIHGHFHRGGTKQTLARGLIDASRREGSGDNMSVIVLYFDTFQMPSAPKSAASEQPQEEGVAKQESEITDTN